MKSRLVFEDASLWRELLPEEFRSFYSRALPSQFNMWSSLQESLRPKVLTYARNRFWHLFSNALDTKDLRQWEFSESDILSLLVFFERHPSSILLILSVPLSDNELLTSFFINLIDSMNEILALDNVEVDGQFSTAVISSKAKIFSNFRGQVEGVMRLKGIATGSTRGTSLVSSMYQKKRIEMKETKLPVSSTAGQNSSLPSSISVPSDVVLVEEVAPSDAPLVLEKDKADNLRR